MPPGMGRYTIGGRGTHGCKGYPVVGGEGKVHGCHSTRGAAMRQQAAIYASQNQASKAQEILNVLEMHQNFEKSWTVSDNGNDNGYAVIDIDGLVVGNFDNRYDAETIVNVHNSVIEEDLIAAKSMGLAKQQLWTNSPLSFRKI